MLFSFRGPPPDDFPVFFWLNPTRSEKAGKGRERSDFGRKRSDFGRERSDFGGKGRILAGKGRILAWTSLKISLLFWEGRYLVTQGLWGFKTDWLLQALWKRSLIRSPPERRSTFFDRVFLFQHFSTSFYGRNMWKTSNNVEWCRKMMKNVEKCRKNVEKCPKLLIIVEIVKWFPICANQYNSVQSF